MSGAVFHLAQINIAKAVAPAESPVMKGFVDLLEPVHALADVSPGFVWRLQTEEGNREALRVFGDPLMLVNLTVWDSIEALEAFTYRSGHVEAFRRRSEWFERPSRAYMALWWIPAGHIPTLDEANERLEFREQHGDSPLAFSFKRRFAAPPAPDFHAAVAESRLSYEGRRFRMSANSNAGDCSCGTLFRYFQRGNRVWAFYAGDVVRLGTLVGVADETGRLTATYHQADSAGAIWTGQCTSAPEVLSDGRLRLHEEWSWVDRPGSGQAVLEELL